MVPSVPEKVVPLAPEKTRGSIVGFATYRPAVPLDIFSCPLPVTTTSSKQDEFHMTDGVSYNYNGQVIPPAALKTILPKLVSEDKEADVVSGMVFVSERSKLETLHIALYLNHDNVNPHEVKVFSLADVFGTNDFNGVRMEDNGRIAGLASDYLVYVSTKEPAVGRRQPWTAVYKTNLETGITDRLTPPGEADLSPSVSPSGKKIAIASFQNKGGWKGEIEDLKTDIYVMNVEEPFERELVVQNGGWPTWGSEDVIFFHRNDDTTGYWGVYQADITNDLTTNTPRVTPDDIHAITPAAINATTVAVATFSTTQHQRHIEIFDTTEKDKRIQLTQNIDPEVDHFNPFVIDGGKRIGYHLGNSDLYKSGHDIQTESQQLESPDPDVGLLRVSGVFPSFSKDGSKLAFVDNEFKAVYVADTNKLRIVFKPNEGEEVFSPVWNKEKDILYVCVGKSFHANEPSNIWAIPDVSSITEENMSNATQLTDGSNNAFPSTNPDGTKLVFRSTRDSDKSEKKIYKNLYIMEDAQLGEYGDGKITRLTNGRWTDTHCQWSPSGDWIVFSSSRDKPEGAPDSDNKLDPGYFAVFLVKANDPLVVVRVITSAIDLSGHVNHPIFSPDGKSIVVTADLAAVSVDPISLPHFLHSVRPYGDIFTVDIQDDDIYKNNDVMEFNRITHSRYENSASSWTMFSATQLHLTNAAWNLLFKGAHTRSCPHAYGDGGQSRHMTGHLHLPKRRC